MGVEIMVLGSMAVIAAWDFGRRHYAARESSKPSEPSAEVLDLKKRVELLEAQHRETAVVLRNLSTRGKFSTFQR